MQDLYLKILLLRQSVLNRSERYEVPTSTKKEQGSITLDGGGFFLVPEDFGEMFDDSFPCLRFFFQVEIS